ncbi:unnamed protein product [Auanema sp. JU1783]|nr:unnamed protein product [Auanema sp. JU1783]
MGAEHSSEMRPRSHTTLSGVPESRRPRLSCPDYMTQYDVKQLMKQQDFDRHNKDLSSHDDQTEEGKSADPLQSLHHQFSKNRPVEAKLSVRSNVSDISVDSGLEADHLDVAVNGEDSPIHSTNHSSTSMDRNQIPKILIENSTPLTTPTTTPTAYTQELPFQSIHPEFHQKKKISNFFFSKKHRKHNVEERARSKSLGSYTLSSEKPGPLFGSSLLNREWELVTVSELCRRLSLDGKDLELPIPEGSDKSQILDELMIRQIVETLPPRAMGYPWVNIYSSEKHGFSLATLYRKMVEFDEDLSPVLLIIRDTDDHIFGAIVSGAIRPSDHFVGTGDSCQLWRFTGQAPNTRDLRPYQWTGENQFFVNANKDYLAIGAGSGHYGLWLDADLNHGRSQRCDTFDNELLAGDKEDFIVQYVEAFGFRM